MMRLTNYVVHVFLKQRRLLNYFHSLDCSGVIGNLISSPSFEITGCLLYAKGIQGMLMVTGRKSQHLTQSFDTLKV